MKSMQKGFSLIELLIVVAIIGILAAVAIPQYQNYTINSADRACMNDVRTYAGQVAIALNVSNPVPTVADFFGAAAGTATNACTAIVILDGAGDPAVPALGTTFVVGTPVAPGTANQTVAL